MAYACHSRGKQYCPLNDNLAALVTQIKEPTACSLVSPVYMGNVSELMKSLIDRMAWAAPPLFHPEASDASCRDHGKA